MTMKPCKECGNQVSTKAETCPNCGRQRPGGGVSGTVVLATVIIGVVLLLLFGWRVMDSYQTLNP